MISFACSDCGKKLRAPPQLAGKRVRCPRCSCKVRVPATPTLSTPPPASSHTLPAVLPAVPSSPGTVSDLPMPRSPTVAEHDGRNATETIGGTPVDAGVANELTKFLNPAEAPDEIGRLASYRILKLLGSGGMGAVFLAEDPHLQRKVALKIMLPSLALSENAKKRFLREARAAAAIEHDHIVHINVVGEDRGVPFLTMPFLQGERLDQRLDRELVLPVPEALRIGRETAEGLAAAHERGLIHRDIKPANLWLEGRRGRVKILDFGLARATGNESGLTQLGAILGTPAYMSPEQANGKPADGRCDLFSLGCVLYRMTTGAPAFEGPDALGTLMAVCTEDPMPPCVRNPAIPQTVSDLLLWLLAKKPEDRPQSALIVVEALQALALNPTQSIPSIPSLPSTPSIDAGEPASVRTDSPAATPTAPHHSLLARAHSWWPRIAIAAAAGLLIGGIVALLLLLLKQ